MLMQNPQYAQNFETLYGICQARNVAFQCIKTLTRRPWGEGAHHHATTWYEPFQDQARIDLAVHYALGRPGIFLNTAGDMDVFPKILDAASRFESVPSDEQMQALMASAQAEPLWA
jgi:hypothetical protein